MNNKQKAKIVFFLFCYLLLFYLSLSFNVCKKKIKWEDPKNNIYTLNNNFVKWKDMNEF